MPIFEYLCQACGHRFESIVQGSKVPECPTCKNTQLEKQLSAFAVGGRADSFASGMPAGACGTCGDPRGPGACAID
ncbi:MAG: zinc ribbon domain-containing protein [Nitrospira sp.]|nr:zinc ribbon domain-containing protein [Nitrospira sp.]